MQLRILCVRMENRVSEEDKSIEFWNFFYSHIKFPLTRIFHWFLCKRWIPCHGCDIRLVFTLPPRVSTLQYKRCVHVWNNFPYFITLGPCIVYTTQLLYLMPHEVFKVIYWIYFVVIIFGSFKFYCFIMKAYINVFPLYNIQFKPLKVLF